MGFLAVLLLAALGYALWSGKVKLAQLPPILLTLGGAMIALRGGWMIGIPAVLAGVAWYRGLTWRMFGLNPDRARNLTLARPAGCWVSHRRTMLTASAPAIAS
jgi:hypothetical protein